MSLDKPAMALHCSFSEPVDQAVNCGRARVVQYYRRGRWLAPKKPTTAREVMRWYLNHHDARIGR